MKLCGADDYPDYILDEYEDLINYSMNSSDYYELPTNNYYHKPKNYKVKGKSNHQYLFLISFPLWSVSRTFAIIC